MVYKNRVCQNIRHSFSHSNASLVLWSFFLALLEKVHLKAQTFPAVYSASDAQNPAYLLSLNILEYYQSEQGDGPCGLDKTQI